MPAAGGPDPLRPSHDALAALDACPRTLIAQGAAGPVPVATIGITTYRRPELLAEAVRSAANQVFDRPFEIVICDNDPPSADVDGLLARVPQLRDHQFRYYVNDTNIGSCQNNNRCIQLARAPWVTILHDDDLLLPDFLSASFAVLARDASIDGLVGMKAHLDQREHAPAAAAAPGAMVRARRLVRRAMMELIYRGGSSRRLTARKLFWGPVAGNVAGFVFRRECAVAIGGLIPDEEPNSDYWFFTRFAQRFHLRQQRQVVARIRVAVNESANPATIAKMFAETHRFRQTLAGHAVPGWWRHLSPYLVARSRVELRDYWGVDIPPDEVGRLIGHRLPGHHPMMIWAAKFLLRGY